ncbi:MAG: hypothetical protein KY461_05215 [Actinobacteria bacterium]|nr:hypothetical protein [Actinomycetota bacterium]
MRARIATLTVGMVAGLLVAAAPTAPEGSTYEATQTRVNNAITCIRDESNGTTCASTTYTLSTELGDSTVGSLPGPTTPVNSAAYYVDGVYSYQAFTAGKGIAGVTFIADAGRPLTGQVTLSGWRELPDLSADAAVSIRLTLRSVDEAGKTTTRRLETEVTKTVMVPGDNVFAYEFDLPAEFDGRETTISSMDLGLRGVHVLTNGFIDGQGGSFFDLPTWSLVEDQV